MTGHKGGVWEVGSIMHLDIGDCCKNVCKF